MSDLNFEAILENAIAEINEPQIDKTLISANDLINQYKDVYMIKLYGRFIHKGDVTFIFGGEGVGKTYYAIHLGNNFANGNNQIDNEPNEAPPLKVLYNNRELNNTEIVSRYRNYSFSSNFTFTDYNFCYENDVELDLSYIENKAPNFDVIFIDNLSIFSDVDLTDGHKATYLMKQLKRIAFKYDVTLIVIGHPPKLEGGGLGRLLNSKDMGGSKKLTDLATNVIAVGNLNDVNYIRFLKTRNGSKSKMLKTFTITENGFEYLNEISEDVLVPLTPAKEQKLEKYKDIASKYFKEPTNRANFLNEYHKATNKDGRRVFYQLQANNFIILYDGNKYIYNQNCEVENEF